MHLYSFYASRKSKLLIAATLFLCTAARAQTAAPANASAQTPQTYRVGMKSIAIPSPSNDLTEIGPDYRVVLETLVPPVNRLVAAFNRPEDLHQILAGGNTPLPKYAFAEVPRSAEFVDADAAAFKIVAGAVAQEFGANLEVDVKTAQDDLNHNLKELNSNSAAIAIDKPLPLGALFSKPDAAAFGVIEAVSAQGPTTKLVVSTVVLRAQNRILLLYLFGVYKDESTVQWARKTSEQWADAVLAANKQ
jgi:hypothetical protein